ncbi:MAG: B12-binding domain-containing radical SAM protein, partial [Thermodesulfobacteriota bacterium]
MPKKVLLISTNREKSPFAVAPVGAAKVLAALQAAGHEAELLDLCFTRNLEHAVKKRIKAFRPDLVGLSIRNLDNCAYIRPHAYFETDARMVRAVRKYSPAPIVIGGSGVSVAPKELAEHLGVPYAFVGEGEKSLPAFLRALENGHSFDGIPGLLFRNGSGWQGTVPDFSSRMDELPFQAAAAIDYKKYFARGGFLPVQTKRGCP